MAPFKIIDNSRKAVEEFLGHVLVQAKADKQTMPLIDVVIPEVGLTSVEIGSEQYYHYATLGSFYHYISANGTSLLKADADKVNVVEYLAHWMNTIRTSSFDKKALLTVEKAQVLRRETLVVLRRLLADLAN